MYNMVEYFTVTVIDYSMRMHHFIAYTLSIHAVILSISSLYYIGYSSIIKLSMPAPHGVHSTKE